jgi:hypothetical protein
MLFYELVLLVDDFALHLEFLVEVHILHKVTLVVLLDVLVGAAHAQSDAAGALLRHAEEVQGFVMFGADWPLELN